MVAASSSSCLDVKLPSTSAQLVKALESIKHDERGIREGLMPMLEGLTKLGNKGEQVLANMDRVGASNDPLAKYLDENADRRQFESPIIELVYMLSARLSYQPSEKSHTMKAMNLAKHIAASGSPELFSYTVTRLGLFATGIVDLAVYLGQPMLAMRPLEDLLHRMPKSSLSGVHAAYLEVCLITRNFMQALPVVDTFVLDVRRVRYSFQGIGLTRKTMPSYVHVLTFYHHAGLICAALKDWRRAREMFEVCLVLPGFQASAIQLAAAKRAILCEALWSGKSYTFPRQTSSSVSRATDSKIYSPIRDAFGSARWSDVQNIIQRDLARGAESVLVADDNVGLANQVLAAIPKRKIWKLTQTYSRMSLADVAMQIGHKGKEADVEQLIIDMIKDERSPLRAQLSDHNSPAGTRIVTFSKVTTSQTAAKQAREIENLNHISEWWERVLSDRAKDLGMDHKWLKKQASRLESNQLPPEVAMAEGEDLMPKKGLRGAGADWNDAGF